MSAEKQYSVLVADDDIRISRVISQILSSDGMHVTVTQSGREVLSLVQKQNFDLIMVDILFAEGDMDGFSIIDAFRRNNINTPIFVISALAEESQIMLFFLQHVNWVVTSEQLYEAVWHNRIVDNNTIMVHISKLRNKIEKNPRMPTYIKTIRGIGYQFVRPEGA